MYGKCHILSHYVSVVLLNIIMMSVMVPFWLKVFYRISLRVFGSIKFDEWAYIAFLCEPYFPWIEQALKYRVFFYVWRMLDL
jgi:hypothetical protein